MLLNIEGNAQLNKAAIYDFFLSLEDKTGKLDFWGKSAEQKSRRCASRHRRIGTKLQGTSEVALDSQVFLVTASNGVRRRSERYLAVPRGAVS